MDVFDGGQSAILCLGFRLFFYLAVALLGPVGLLLAGFYNKKYTTGILNCGGFFSE